MKSSEFTSGPVRYLTAKELGVSDFSDFELLSDSGHNLVYRAMCGGKWVVLKCARVEEGSTTRNQQLLRREYDIMRAIDSLYVVRTWQMTDVPGLGMAIVMEYVHGRTLDAFLQEKPSYSERKRVAEELIEALSSLHERQIVHGDLKGTNILITEVGNHVQLIDFGFADKDAYIAKNIGTSPSVQSPHSSTSSSAETADIQRDIYAFGKILTLLFPRRFRIARKCCLDGRYTSIREVQKAMQRHVRCLWMIAVVGCVAAIVIVVFSWPRNEPPEAIYIPPQKDTVVIVTPAPEPVAPTPKRDTIIKYQQVYIPAEPAPTVDSLWLEIKQKLEKIYEENYCLSADSILNMAEPDKDAALNIHHNYCGKVYYMREQLVADYPDYEDQIMTRNTELYGMYYTR